MNPSEELTLTAKEEALIPSMDTQPPAEDQKLEAADAPEKKTAKDAKETNSIQVGDWAEIIDSSIAELFYEKKAKVVQLIKGIVDKQGTPVLEPKTNASAREKARYEFQLSIGVREETKAVLFGLNPDQTRMREYEKTVPTGKLKKINAPLEEPKIKKPTPVPKKKTVHGDHGDGRQFLNPNEIKSEPKRRRFNRE